MPEENDPWRREMEIYQKATHTMVRELHQHVVGSPGTDGLTTRVAKVEQRQGLIMRVFGAVGAALVGIAVWLVKERS